MALDTVNDITDLQHTFWAKDKDSSRQIIDNLDTSGVTEALIVDRLTAQNGPPTAFCSRIMSLGTNDTWTKWKILSSGRF